MNTGPIIFFTILTISNIVVASDPPSCLVCKLPVSNSASAEGQSSACDDLFGAACVGKDGRSKFQDSYKKLSKDLAQPIKDARSKTLQTLGYKSYDEAIKSKLALAGIELKEPVDAEAWSQLIGESNSYSSDNAKKLYKSVDQCNQDAQELQKNQYWSISDAGQLRDILSKFEGMQANYKEKAIKLYAKDIAGFVGQTIGSNKCQKMETTSYYKPEDNAELKKICDNYGDIKRQAVELFRREGTPGYDEAAEKFVRENFPPELKYSMPSTTSSTTGNTPAPQKTEVDLLREKIGSANSAVSNYCQGFSSAVENAAKKTVADVNLQTAKAKITIDNLVDNVYTADRQKKANELFQKAKSDIQDLVRTFVNDSSKKSEIISGYDDLKLFWLNKPGSDAYVKDKDGLQVLDITKLPPNPADQTSTTFLDPSLSFFGTVNAFYSPSTSYGKMKSDEQVNIMPGMLSTIDKNPMAYLSIVAHEAGHKIGPMVTKINGYDLSNQYNDLMNCYRSNNSIKLEENQMDETMADYFSSEVLAREISKLPVDKRKVALISAVEPFCVFDDNFVHTHTIMCKENHPDPTLRVGGIFGGNPSIRKALGCEGDSSKFKTCGLKKSILNAPETQTLRSSPLGNSGSQSDSNMSRGVK